VSLRVRVEERFPGPKVFRGGCGSEMSDARKNDEWPVHLREDEPPAGICNVCGRKTWENPPAAECKMTQPNGSACLGRFYVPSEAQGGPR
jgi:hypothetical protein